MSRPKVTKRDRRRMTFSIRNLSRTMRFIAHSILRLSSSRRAGAWACCRGLSSLSESKQVHEPFKVLFLGRDHFSCVVLEQLHKATDVWNSLDIVTLDDRKVGRRGSKLSVSPLKTLGQNLGLPIHTIPPTKEEFKTWQLPAPFGTLENPPPSHILVTASFGRILTSKMLHSFGPNRCLNVHPSLLPAYRGPAPIQHTMLDGRTETGVCVIEMLEFKKGIDAGRIFGQAQHPVPPMIEFKQLRDELALKGGNVLVNVLRQMLDGEETSEPQASDDTAPHAPLVTSELALINFDTMTAEEITRRSRALRQQRVTWCYMKNGQSIQLHHLSCTDTVPAPILDQLSSPGLGTYDPSSSCLVVRCAGDTFLRIEMVKRRSRALLPAKEWWNGLRPEMRLKNDDTSPVVFLGTTPTE